MTGPRVKALYTSKTNAFFLWMYCRKAASIKQLYARCELVCVCGFIVQELKSTLFHLPLQKCVNSFEMRTVQIKIYNSHKQYRERVA